jgi:hypothetical protein
MPHLGADAPMKNPGKGPMNLWIPGENPVRRKT